MGEHIHSDPWDHYRKGIADFPTEDVRAILSQPASWMITGEPGAGKSVFLLWSLERALAKRGRAVAWFKRIVFLSPSQYKSWAAALSQFDSSKTLVAVDAPFRMSDSKQVKQAKAQELARVMARFRSGVQEAGPFHLLATVRNEEYDFLVDYMRPRRLEIKPDQVRLWTILCHHLKIHRVRNEVHASDVASAQFILFKRGGIPLYCELLARYLSSTQRGLTMDTLNEVPAGTGWLFLHALRKVAIDDDTFEEVLALVAALARHETGFSDAFVIRAIDLVTSRDVRTKMTRVWGALKRHYLTLERQVDGASWWALKSHWVSALEGIAPMTPSTADIGETLLNSREMLLKAWSAAPDYTNRVAEPIDQHLRGGLRGPDDFSLCIDLAKLDVNHAIRSVAFVTAHAEENPTMPEAYRKELQRVLVLTAHRSADLGERAIQNTRTYFNLLFQIHPEPQHVQACISFLVANAIPLAQTDLELANEKNNVLQLYELLLKIDSKNKQSWAARASFWHRIGDFDKAELDFKKAISIDSGDVVTDSSTLHAYATFLVDRADVIWSQDPQKASTRFQTALDYFEQGFNRLPPNAGAPVDRLRVFFLNAHAVALITAAKKQIDVQRQAELDSRAVQLLRDALKIDPSHTPSTNVLANLLIYFGWALPEYRRERGKQFRDAYEVLKNGLARQGENRDAFTLHILGRLLYRPLPGSKVDFTQAENYIRESKSKGGLLQRAIAAHELGKLYLQWASVLKRHSRPYDSKLKQAEHAFKDSLGIPVTRPHYRHLTYVYASCAHLEYFRGKPDVARFWISKLADIVAVAQRNLDFVPKPVDEALSDFGDDLLAEGGVDEAVAAYLEAIDRNPGNWYAAARLAYCHSHGHAIGRKLDFVSILRFANIATKAAKTSAAHASIRNLLNQVKQQMMRGDTVDEGAHTDRAAWRTSLLEIMLENSRRAHQLSPEYWKNLTDYAEDLLANCDYSEAIRIARQATILLAATVRKARHKAAGRKRMEANTRESRTRIKWLIGKSQARLGRNPLQAEKLLWRAAKLENSTRGWYELASVAAAVLPGAEPFIKALEQYRHACSGTKANPRDSSVEFGKLFATAERRFKENNLPEAALVARYGLVFRLFADRRPQHKSFSQLFGLTGFWLRQVGQLELAFECFVTSLRLDPSPDLRRKNLTQLATVAMRLNWVALARETAVLAQALETSPEWKERLDEMISGLRDEPLTEAGHRLVNELQLGPSATLDFYRALVSTGVNLADGGGQVLPPRVLLRIAADAFSIARDFEFGPRACSVLARHVSWPEDVFVRCLEWQLRAPLDVRPHVPDVLPLTPKPRYFKSIWKSWIRRILRNLAHIKGKFLGADVTQGIDVKRDQEGDIHS